MRFLAAAAVWLCASVPAFSGDLERMANELEWLNDRLLFARPAVVRPVAPYPYYPYYPAYPVYRAAPLRTYDLTPVWNPKTGRLDYVKSPRY